MSTLMVVNPKRRKRRASTKKRRARSTHRRTRVHHMRTNPRRRKRSHHRAVTVHRRHHTRRLRRNPRRLSGGRALSLKGFVNHTLVPASIGAGGGILLNLLTGYLPLPTALNNNFVKPVVGLAGALAIGVVGSKVAGRRAGEQMAMGAAVVVIYNVVKGLVTAAAPNLPLSDYNTVGWVNPGMPVGGMGEYVGAQPSASVVQPMAAGQTVQGFGEYVGF